MVKKFAALQHEIWSHWMKYLFEVSIEHEDGSITIPAGKVARWKRQIDTDYDELSPEEQESDIEQAIKIIRLFNGLKKT